MSLASRKVVAVSGSVRAASSNTTLLRAAIASAPPGVEIALYDGLLALPLALPA
jgi:NAD(P)H-dependent FMN reductase